VESEKEDNIITQRCRMKAMHMMSPGEVETEKHVHRLVEAFPPFQLWPMNREKRKKEREKAKAKTKRQ